MAQVTAPVILDSTGQQIVTALNNLSNNVKPTADQIKRTSSNNQTVEAALVSLNSQLGGLIGYKTNASTQNNNTLIVNLESTTSTKEYMILGFGISAGQQTVGFILYARASTGTAAIKAFGDRALTATYSNGTVQIKGANYTVLNLISNNPITTGWTNT